MLHADRFRLAWAIMSQTECLTSEELLSKFMGSNLHAKMLSSVSGINEPDQSGNRGLGITRPACSSVTFGLLPDSGSSNFKVASTS